MLNVFLLGSAMTLGQLLVMSFYMLLRVLVGVSSSIPLLRTLQILPSTIYPSCLFSSKEKKKTSPQVRGQVPPSNIILRESSMQAIVETEKSTKRIKHDHLLLLEERLKKDATKNLTRSPSLLFLKFSLLLES